MKTIAASLARLAVARAPRSQALPVRTLYTATSTTRVQSSLPHFTNCDALQRRWKSKRSSVQHIDPHAADDDDVPVMKTKGKGGGKGKAGAKDGNYKTTVRNDELPGENFDKDAIAANMKRAVERCRSTTSQLAGSFGRADPSLLNAVKVETDGVKHSLQECATVGVRDGMLIVTAFDADNVKAITQAIYTADIGLTPQASSGSDDANMIRVAVPKPTTETRQAMFKELTKICENARISIRNARHAANKQIKADIDQKVVGKNEGEKELKQIDADTKKFTAEVDQLLAKLKTNLLSPN